MLKPYVTTFVIIARRVVVFPFLTSQLKGKRKTHLCDLSVFAVRKNIIRLRIGLPSTPNRLNLGFLDVSRTCFYPTEKKTLIKIASITANLKNATGRTIKINRRKLFTFALGSQILRIMDSLG